MKTERKAMLEAMRASLFAVSALLVFLLGIPAPLQAQTMGVNTQKASMSEVVEAAMQPMESDPVTVYKASSLATAEALAATVPTNQRTVRFSQEVTVENLHASISVCVYTVPAGDACTSITASCRGGAAPKMIVPPAKSKKFRFAGTRDLCAITSAIAGEWQAERLIVQVGAR